MKFQYYKLPINNCPIDNAIIRYRPMLPIEISINNKNAWFDALIDSGADYNMAPLEMLDIFDINPEKYPSLEFTGIEPSVSIKTYLIPVSLKFGGHRIQTHIGFGGNVPTILLGQKGFFDKIKKVTFDYPLDVEIKI